MSEASFTMSVNPEGPSQSLRGKLPTGLINLLGCAAGDVIEFTVSGSGKNAKITDSKVLKGKAADSARASNRSQSRAFGRKKEATPAKEATAATAQPKTAAKKVTSAKKVASSAGNGKTQAKAAPVAKKVAVKHSTEAVSPVKAPLLKPKDAAKGKTKVAYKPAQAAKKVVKRATA